MIKSICLISQLFITIFRVFFSKTNIQHTPTLLPGMWLKWSKINKSDVYTADFNKKDFHAAYTNSFQQFYKKGKSILYTLRKNTKEEGSFWFGYYSKLILTFK